MIKLPPIQYHCKEFELRLKQRVHFLSPHDLTKRPERNIKSKGCGSAAGWLHLETVLDLMQQILLIGKKF